MKKLLISLVALVFSATTVLAQSDVFNHLAVGAGVGTQGISIDVATTLTKYAAIRAGVNFMPNFKVKGNLMAHTTYVSEYPVNGAEVSARGEFQRTTFDFMVDVYPFANGFFVTAGFSAGGGNLAKLSGKDKGGYLDNIDYIELDKYIIPVKNGEIAGNIKVNSFRPYFGLGYGRAVPKNRVACRVELGVQLHGKPVPTTDYGEVKISTAKRDDDLSKIVDKLTVYPVLKFRIAGRIF